MKYIVEFWTVYNNDFIPDKKPTQSEVHNKYRMNFLCLEKFNNMKEVEDKVKQLEQQHKKPIYYYVVN